MGSIACVKPPQTIFTIHGIIVAYYIDFWGVFGRYFCIFKEKWHSKRCCSWNAAFTEDFGCRRIEKSRRERFMDENVSDIFLKKASSSLVSRKSARQTTSKLFLVGIDEFPYLAF